MKAVILAAGMGTRLGTLIPKPLTSLKNEKSIFDFQVEKLSNLVGVNNIIVVVGYKKELIMEKHPELTFVYNEAYTRTNTAKSLLKALNKINDDVIWMNGDVYFENEVLDLLKNPDSSICLVNNNKCQDEEIKYKIDGEGYICELSKSVKDGLGEAIGINLVKKSDLKNFKDELIKVEDSDYFEKALENLFLCRKLKLKPILLNNLFCKEIDFECDLVEVQNYLNKKNVI